MELIEYLQKAVEADASDLFVITGTPVSIKAHGRMVQLSEERVMPEDARALIEDMYARAGRDMVFLTDTGDDDFSFAAPGLARFRVNTYRQRGTYAAVVRIVKFSIPDWRQSGIPENVMKLAQLRHGMVDGTGTAAAGKSTTDAPITAEINRTRDCHIITLEDPIEYLHRNQMSIVSQREIAIDTKDALSGLRACLRQAPDVIQLGEMRDLETIRTAMTAAETGHFILATLHTKGAVNTIDRIIDTFPPEQQTQIRVQIGSVLRTVVAQQLLPDVNGGRVPAFEIMHVTNAVQNHILKSETNQIDNVISSGAAEGMISMDQSILGLFRAGRISKETAVTYASDPDSMARRVNR